MFFFRQRLIYTEEPDWRGARHGQPTSQLRDTSDGRGQIQCFSAGSTLYGASEGASARSHGCCVIHYGGAWRPGRAGPGRRGRCDVGSCYARLRSTLRETRRSLSAVDGYWYRPDPRRRPFMPPAATTTVLSPTDQAAGWSGGNRSVTLAVHDGRRCTWTLDKFTALLTCLEWPAVFRLLMCTASCLFST